MKIIIRFIAVYLIFTALIFSFYFNVNSAYQEKLQRTQNELAGVEYLKSLYTLSVDLALYTEFIEVESEREELLEAKAKMLTDVDEIYRLRKKYPQFKNQVLHERLEKLRKSHFNPQDYYDFLDFINHENYRVGDISHLLFEEDREIYFLSSLITHYLPEYLISALIVHTQAEKFLSKGSISEKNKNLYTEQNKLMYLSSEELSGIIEFLQHYQNSKKLTALMQKIRNTLDTLNTYSGSLSKWEINLAEQGEYLAITYELIDLSYELNDEANRILFDRLTNREKLLQEDILNNRLSLLFILLLITFLSLYFYRVYLSNIEKDAEIKKINDTLNNLVVFSRTDQYGNITYVSSALEELSGYSKRELIGKTHRLFRHEEMDNELFADMWSTIMDKRPWEGELKNRKKDGSSYWAKVTITPELDESGEIEGFNAYRENITDKKDLEVEKQRSQKALKFKSMFLSNMSHEIRTPLNGIIGFTDVALKNEMSPKLKELITKIKSASDLLLNIINDILDISKIESGKMKIEKIPFNLRNTIQNIENLFHIKAQEKGISLEVDYANLTQEHVLGDPVKFSQVLTNLVSNAIKFTSQGGVEIRLKELGNNRIRFSVVDTGVGLKQEQLKTLFNEFTQADMSTTRKYGGTGLGLAISKSLVELMDGEISVSSSFSVGSTFSFELTFEPASDFQLDQQDEEENDLLLLEEKVNALKDINILVAEDNKMNQMLLEMLLENSQLKLDFAEDGELALRKFREDHYDIILMDIQMPNMNGYEATKEIRAMDKDIPIIALSANVMEADIKASLESGMNDHLAKPIDMKALYKALIKYLAA